MMEEKTKFALLGIDHPKMSSVVEKVNGTRPVYGTAFTDLKDFLAFCVEHRPEIVGLSVSFPHKSVMQFPKVFKMALNAQVIIFAENDDIKTRKLLGSILADFKITGQLTAHNLWMKIISCKKAQEGDNPDSSSGSAMDKKKSKPGNAVHLKGGQDTKLAQEKNSLLNSLLAGLGEPSSSQVDSKLSHLQSSSDEDDSKLNAVAVGGDGFQKNKGNGPDSAADQATGMAGKKDLGVLLTNSGGGGQGESNFDSSETPKFENTKPSGSKKNSNSQGGQNLENKNKADLSDSQNLENKNNDNPRDGQKSENKSSNSQSLKKENQNGEEAYPPDQEGGGSKDKKKPNDFGSVKLADADQIKAEEKKKQKQKKEQDFEKHKSILIEACEKGLKEVFGSNNLKESKTFKNKKLYSFIVEMSGLRGYLLLATSSSQDLDRLRLKDFRATVLEHISNAGISLEISTDFSIDEQIKSYPEICEVFCDFTIHSSNDHGQFVHSSFVTREAVWPKFEDSDKEKMYFVDIMKIPPHTPVNFDAYIYLPKNNKFVRYLKEGRSLSLEQAKRHTQTASKTKFYLPHEHKNNFIKFFIQNTIKWEFVVHQGKEEAA